MPVRNDPLPPVTPSDLPRDTLITYDQFVHLMGPNPPLRDTIQRYAREGRWLPGVRMSPRKPMVFRAGDVADFLAERMTGLDVVTDAPGAAPVDLDALIDGLNEDSTDAEVDAVARAIVADDPAVDYRSATFARFRKVLGMAGAPAMKLLVTIRREVAAEARA